MIWVLYFGFFVVAFGITNLMIHIVQNAALTQKYEKKMPFIINFVELQTKI